MANWVLVPCPGRRTGELTLLLNDLEHDRENVCIVTTLPDPVRFTDVQPQAANLIVLGEEIHYGRWLNAGMDCITKTDPAHRYVFITGSDTRADASVVSTLVQGAVTNGFVMCGPDHWGMGTCVLDPKVQRGRTYRVPPEYFLLDLRAGIRFDEQFRWWYSDDDLEMQARQTGKVGLVAGVDVSQNVGHELSNVLHQWAMEDLEKFVQKWGKQPW